MEVLDDLGNHDTNKREFFLKVSLISICGLLLLLFWEKILVFLPDFLMNTDGFQLGTSGIILFSVIISISIVLSNVFHNFRPEFTIPQIVFTVGLIIFAIEFIFKLIQNVVLMETGWDLIYFSLISIAAMLGGFGALVANIRIHKLRKKSRRKPILLLGLYWIIIAFIYK